MRDLVTDFIWTGIDEASGCGVAFVVFLGRVFGYLVRGAKLNVGFVEVGRYPLLVSKYKWCCKGLYMMEW